MPLLGSRAVFAPVLLACYAITAAIHVASIILNGFTLQHQARRLVDIYGKCIA